MAGQWMDEMHQRHLDREDTEYLCQLHDSRREQNLERSMAIRDDEYHEEEPVQSHSTPPPLADVATTPLDDQQLDFGQAMTTLANNNPQEANPEGAESPLQQTSVQAIHDSEDTPRPPIESLDVDFGQAPQQPTSLAERNDVRECIHFHRAPLPVLTLLSRAAGVSVTEAQHFTVEQAIAILTSDSTWASSTPPQEDDLVDPD